MSCATAPPTREEEGTWRALDEVEQAFVSRALELAGYEPISWDEFRRSTAGESSGR